MIPCLCSDPHGFHRDDCPERPEDCRWCGREFASGDLSDGLCLECEEMEDNSTATSSVHRR
jgi:hypothetical protein